VHRQIADPHEEAGVLVAADLTPAEAAELDRSRVAAVLLAFGSPTAHSTILLRTRSIPAVVAAGPAVLGIADGALLAVDGTLGELVVDPPANVLATWRARAAHLAR
jgi:multiphosphoryl transfer protein